MNNLKLTIELVPKTLWYRNLRSELSPEKWKQITGTCAQSYRYRCGICSGRGKFHPVECHEIWNYDDTRRIQTLTGIISLCPDCHKVKHYGLACAKGEEEYVFAHFCKINGLPETEAVEIIESYFDEWSRRSEFSDWKADLSWLTISI